MKKNTRGQRFLAIVVLVAFLMSSIPMMAVSAKNVDELANESASNEISNLDIDSENIIDASIRENDDKAPEKELKSRERPEESKTVPKASKPQKIKEDRVKVKKAPRVISEKPDKRASKKNPVVSYSIIPPEPKYVPAPPSLTWTEVTGALVTQTWTVADSPYYVTGDITIPVGATLTIDPGVQVLFNGSFNIFVDGTFNATGGAGNLITFTSNFAGFWGAITFNSTGTGRISYSNITFATNAIIMNGTSNTIEVDFNIIGNITNYGIWLYGPVTGGHNIHDNTFNTSNFAVYADIVFAGMGSASLGDITLTDNVVNGPLGFFYNQLYFDTPVWGSNIAVGQTVVTDNIFTNSQRSIFFGDYGVDNMAYGTVTWGNIYINDNTIIQTGGSDAIYFYGYIYNVTDVIVNIGTLDISGNDITNTIQGIDLEFWNIQELRGTTAVYVGTTTVKDNVINNTGAGGHGIYVLWDYVGYYLYDFALLSVGDFFISNNMIIDSGNRGIYFYGDDYIGYYMYDYSAVNIGNIFIEDNTVLSAGSEGLYVYIYDAGYEMYQNSVFTMGDINIRNNDITSDGRGLYFYMEDFGYYMYHDSSVSVGTFDISGNDFNSTNDYGGYYYVSEFGAYMFGNSRAIFQDLIVMNNNFTSQSGTYAFRVSSIERIGYEMYGNSQVYFGDILFNRNNFDGWRYGFRSYYGDNAYNMYDNSYVEIGDLEMNNNTIISNRDPAYISGDGIRFSSDYIGYEMWGSSRATIGHMLFNDNNIQVMNGINADGMRFSYIDDYGSNMYGTATFEMTGNLEISRNRVNATPGYYGIYLEIYDIGYDMYGDNTATFQDFLMNDNTVWADDYGIYSSFYYFGYNMYGQSAAAFGDIEMNRNTVWSDGSRGVYSEWYELGNYLYANNLVTFGRFQQNDNVVNASNGYGWYGELYDWGYYNYGNSRVYFGDYEFLRNTINSSWEGAYFDWYDFASYMYGYSEAYFGSFYVNDNNINSTGNTGIYWTDYIYDFGYEMYDNSYAEFGDFELQRNNIISDNYGIYAYSGYNGYDIYDSAYVSFGSVLWNWNNINNSGINRGIYFEMEYFGAYVYYNGQAYFGDIEIDNNTIVSGGDGIEFIFYEVGYYIEENGIFVLGDVRMNDNNIDTVYYISGDDGIYMYGYEEVGYEIEDNAYFRMGDTEMMRNTINASGDGINWYYYYNVGSYFDGNAQGYFGDVLVSENDITAGGYGMYFSDWYYVGYYLYDSSIATFGDFKFNDNTINSSSSGIYFSNFYEWGAYFYYGGWMTVGNFEFLRNNITSAGGYGIYIEPYQFAYYIYDDSTFTMGDWLFNYNNITSFNAALYTYFYEFAEEMYGSSRAVFGDREIMYNALNSTNGYGIYDWWLYEFGYYMYEDSYAGFGEARIMYNNITSWSDDGMYLGPYEYGYYVYDTADVMAGDYLITDNTIYSDSNIGIDFYLYYVGYDLDSSSFSYSTSTVTLGDVKINDNVITSPGDYGIYVDPDTIGYSINYDSSVTVGNFEIMRNTITGYDGIYFYYNEIGWDVYDTATVTMGWVDISGNTIDADINGNYGIFIDRSWLADYIYNNARLFAGDINVYNNNIVNSSEGIYIYTGWSGYTSEMAYAEMAGVYAYDNTVNSDSYGLRIEYYNSPGNIPVDSVQVWGTVEVYDSTFISGNGLRVVSDGTSTMPPTYLHDLTFTAAGTNSTSRGIYATDTLEFRVDNSQFNNYYNGIYTDANANLRVTSSDFTGIGDFDVNLTGASNVFMIDSGFNVSNVNYTDAASILDVGWFLTVNVETPIGNRVPGASLLAVSNGALINETGMTDTNGQDVLLLREARYNQANPWPTPLINFNDHNVTASKSVNTGWAIPEVTMDVSKAITIILGDGIPPSLAPTDMSDTAGTTGDPFTWRIGASDDMGLTRVQITYRIGGGSWTNIDMTVPGTPWVHTANLPHQVGSMEYYFTAYDVGGNPSTPSPTYNAPVTDNDPPLVVDNTPGAITPMFTFNVTATDNIGVANVYLNYWYDANPATNMTMNGAGPYNYTLNINTSYSTLSYFVSAVDAAGLWFTTSTIGPLTIDNTTPVIISDNSDTEASTGDDFGFNVTVSDDFGVVQVNITYQYGNGTWQNTTLTPGNNGTYVGNIIIPADSTDDLNYVIIVTDVGGNVNISNVTSITVVDNDNPVIVTDGSDNLATTGDGFDFSVDVDDNVGIDSVHIIYWYGSGSTTDLTLTGSGTYTGTITIPSGMADDLHYYIVVTDTSGNTFTGTTNDLTVIDNDSPVIISDGSDTAATTGDAFNFSVKASDNIDITLAYVIYWFGNGTRINTTLTDNGAGTYTGTITVPSNSLDELHYYFAFTDAAGNWVTGARVDVKVTDNDAPTFETDETPTEVLEGLDFIFSIPAADNIGMSTVQVVYWTDLIEDYAYAQLTLSDGNYIGTISVPQGAELHYYFIATDEAGNSAQTEEKVLDIQSDGEEAESPSASYWWIIIVIVLVIIIILQAMYKGKEPEEPESIEPKVEDEPPAEPKPAAPGPEPEPFATEDLLEE